MNELKFDAQIYDTIRRNIKKYRKEKGRIGCGLCAKGCPADCIKRTEYIAEGHKLASFEIDPTKCVKCGSCIGTCRVKAITKR